MSFPSPVKDWLSTPESKSTNLVHGASFGGVRGRTTPWSSMGPSSQRFGQRFASDTACITGKLCPTGFVFALRRYSYRLCWPRKPDLSSSFHCGARGRNLVSHRRTQGREATQSRASFTLLRMLTVVLERHILMCPSIPLKCASILIDVRQALRARRVHRGQDSPIQGWYAPEFGKRMPNSVLSFSSDAMLPATLGYLMLPRTERLVPGM